MRAGRDMRRWAEGGRLRSLRANCVTSAAPAIHAASPATPTPSGVGSRAAPMNPALVRLSKFLSLVLRHAPERAGLALDAAGWADVGAIRREGLRPGRRTHVHLSAD